MRLNVVQVDRLARGRHYEPAYGACLVELAAVLGSGVWTDHPPCVPGPLGALARHVNDASTDVGRNLSSHP
jgi:hypothetical protein